MSEERYNKEYTEVQYKNSSNLNARVQLHDRFSTNRYGWIPWVFEHLDIHPEDHILELGCGGGMIWARNLERIPENCSFLLTDFTEGMLQDARNNLTGSRLFEFQLVDVNERPLPFEDASFDKVIANHMLYYIPERQGLFAEIVRILKPGGRFCASTIGKRHLMEMIELLKKVDQKLGEIWADLVASADSFTLDNGEDQLSPLFSGIDLHRYEDSFRITEVDPLIEYILSDGSIDDKDRRLDTIRNLIESEMESQGGVFHISKDSGIFVASV